MTGPLAQPAGALLHSAPVAGRIQWVGAWPVVRRELLSEARNRSNYILRLLSAACLTAMFALLMRNDSVASTSLSLRLFTAAHTLLWCTLWAIGPVLTADAISSEKRQGTLGLLFSTNLTSRGIVLGKSFVHIARLTTVWLAAFPIILIPVLMGGVGKMDLLSAFLLQLCAVVWSPAAGLAASAMVRNPLLGIILGELLALLMSQVFRFAIGAAWVLQASPQALANWLPLTSGSFGALTLALCTGIDPSGSGWNKLAQTDWLWTLSDVLLLSLLAFGLLLSFAACRIAKAWIEHPLSARQQRRRQKWLTPRFLLRTFKARRRHWLDKNPLDWLQQQSVWARLSKMGWCGTVLFVDSCVVMTSQPWAYFSAAQLWTSILLSLYMSYAAVLVFREQRDSGVLELLLVTPVSADDIILREVWAFWRRFFAPVALLLALGELIVWLDMANKGNFDLRLFLLVNLISIPFIGSYTSARCKGFTPAFLFTTACSLGLPLFAPEFGPGFLEQVTSLDLWFLSRWASPLPGTFFSSWAVAFIQMGVAIGCWLGFRSILEHRTPACVGMANSQLSEG